MTTPLDHLNRGLRWSWMLTFALALALACRTSTPLPTDAISFGEDVFIQPLALEFGVM